MLDASSNLANAALENICLACGLCCNGVIFAHVQIQPGDDAERLRSLGLNVSNPKSTVRAPRFAQPCAAFDGCRCRVYAERPTYCREFECILLKSVSAGHTSKDDALEIIRTARQRADTVRRLLVELGEHDDTAPLSLRFRRTRKQMEQAGLSETTAELYGQLTLAVHDLNLLLSEAFYPGDGRGCFEQVA